MVFDKLFDRKTKLFWWAVLQNWGFISNKCNYSNLFKILISFSMMLNLFLIVFNDIKLSKEYDILWTFSPFGKSNVCAFIFLIYRTPIYFCWTNFYLWGFKVFYEIIFKSGFTINYQHGLKYIFIVQNGYCVYMHTHLKG